jgi:hypothetical protein
MHACARCGGSVGDAFRYCPWCATPQRVKLVEFFRAHTGIDAPEKSLRVSRYLDDQVEERHVRFSIWRASTEKAKAEAAVSLDDEEAERLGHFLLDSAPAEPRSGHRLRRILDQLVR